METNQQLTVATPVIHHQPTTDPAMNDIVSLLKRSEPFKACTRTEIERILKPGVKVHHFEQHEVISGGGTTNDGIFFIIKGRAKLFLETKDKNTLIIAIKNQGEILSYEPVFSNTPQYGKAMALEATTACMIAKNDILFLIRHNELFALKIIQELCNNVWESKKKMLNLCYQPVRQRIANSLLYFSEMQNGRESRHSFRANRTDIARFAGVRRETASRLVSEFEKEGILARINDEISIHDTQKLLKISNMYA